MLLTHFEASIFEHQLSFIDRQSGQFFSLHVQLRLHFFKLDTWKVN